MASAAHDDSSGDSRWHYRYRGPWGWGCWSTSGRSGWGSWNDAAPGAGSGESPWGQAYPYWTPHLVPKPVLIVLTVLGFIWWWPIGLVLLFATLCRRPMFCGHRRWAWRQHQPTGSGPGAGWKNWFGGEPPTSGNRAFDDYRADTIRRLEEEQKEFAEFLERLRFAKDKAEFDQFMNDRRNAPPSTPSDRAGGEAPV